MTPGESGLVIVDKPGGLTSHGVVARIRRLAGTRKVGHAGTLDPMATGVLVVGVNRATRLMGHLMLTEKGYDATIRLGVATTTDDAEGEITATADAGHVTEAEVRSALAAFVGDIEQVPTAVSAIKVDGKRAYQRVRDGEEVTLKARPVTVHDLVMDRFAVVDLAGFRGSGVERPRTSTDEVPVVEEARDEPSRSHSTDEVPVVEEARDEPSRSHSTGVVVDVDVSVRCSSGTYIRAIARDLGAVLGVGGHLTALRRTAVGPFALDRAHTLDELAEEFRIVPIAEAARRSFPALDLDDAQAASVRVGRRLELDISTTTGLFAPDGEFLALYEPSDEGARAVAVFVG